MSRLRITLRKSTIGHPQDQKDTARALGLRKLNAAVTRPDNPAIRGMAGKLHHLVTVEAIADQGERKKKPRLPAGRARTVKGPLKVSKGGQEG
jgi:large subunit ribosomal protein L30